MTLQTEFSVCGVGITLASGFTLAMSLMLMRIGRVYTPRVFVNTRDENSGEVGSVNDR